jgi:hypothetical protein
MYIYIKDQFPTNIMPYKLTYYKDSKKYTIAPPFSIEELQTAGYTVVDNPPEVPENYRLEWVNKSWVLTKIVLEHTPTEKERPDDQDPITGEAIQTISK